MSKVLMLLVTLAMFAAMPAMATVPEENGHEDNSDTSSHNHQDGEIDQDAEAGSGGNAGNQACLIQQNAGRDANAACNQEQNFTTQNNVNRGVGGGDVDRFDDDNDVDSVGVGGVGGANVTGVGGVGGGGVQ